MKNIFFLLICFCFIQILSAQTNSSLSKTPEGMWKCSAPDAPYQYQTFNILIEKQADKFTGKLIGEGGMEMPLNNISYKDSTFEIGLYVENSSVTLKLKWNGMKLTGAAITEQGDIGVTGEKIETSGQKPLTTDSLHVSKTDTIATNKKQ